MHLFNHKARAKEVPPPPSLQSMLNKARPELTDYLIIMSPERRAQTDAPFVWKRPFEPEVLITLEGLSYGKCAFCERRFSPEDLLVYRFRPPSRTSDGTSDPIPDTYLWTAFNWHNLYPICADCRPLHPTLFPVAGTRWRPTAKAMADYLDDANRPIRTRETPDFIHPGEWAEGLYLHRLSRDGHLPIVSKDPDPSSPDLRRFALTTQHFSLNRPSLLAARKNALDHEISFLRQGTVGSATDTDQKTVEFASTIWLLYHALYEEFTGRTLRRLKEIESLVEALRKAAQTPVKFQVALDNLIRRMERDAAFLAPVESAAESSEPARPRAAPAPPAPEYNRDHARLTGISIRNYKSLESIDLSLKPELSPAEAKRLISAKQSAFPEAPCLLILGENATGKSSVLEAVILACLSNTERTLLEVLQKGLTLDPDYMGELDSTPRPTASVALTFSDGSRRELQVDREPRSFTTPSDSASAPLVFGYGAHRLYGSAASRKEIRRVETLFYPERSISNPETWLSDLNAQGATQIDDVIQALRYIIEIDDDFENIAPEVDPTTGKTRWIINFKRFRDGPVETDPATGVKTARQIPYTVAQRFDTVSSGYRAVLALVCDVLAGLHEAFPGSMYDARRARAIVAIDEIEAHLHPRWKLTIIDRLRRALPNVTFLFTSHDPLCVRGTVKGEVVVLNRFVNDHNAGPDALPEKVESVEIVQNQDHQTVEQMLNSDLFSLLTTEAETTQAEFAEVADILSKSKEGDDLTEPEQTMLTEFNRQIRDALPFGDSPIPQLVQEAVAEYLKGKGKLSAKGSDEKRKNAINRLKDFLGGARQ